MLYRIKWKKILSFFFSFGKCHWKAPLTSILSKYSKLSTKIETSKKLEFLNPKDSKNLKVEKKNTRLKDLENGKIPELEQNLFFSSYSYFPGINHKLRWSNFNQFII